MRFSFALLLAVSACAQFPALEGTVSPDLANTPFPALIPLSTLSVQADAADQGRAIAPPSLAPRLDTLRRRAAGLRGPVIAQPLRVRMLRGVR